MVFLPNYYENSIFWRKCATGSMQLATGVTLSVIETFILCPLEWVKVYIQTKTITYCFKKLRQDFRSVRSLFFGLEAYFYKQVLSWSTYLYFEKLIRSSLKTYWNKQTLDPSELLFGSSLVGVINTAIGTLFFYFQVQPFDKIKTLHQMQENKSFVKTNFWKLMY